MSQALAFAAFVLGPFSFTRREPNSTDVHIDILFCGVWHSDLHTARCEWPGTVYPCVAGHEIAGRVASDGSGVTKFKAGDMAAVGCVVDSCSSCDACRHGLEQHCDRNATVLTYNSPDAHLPGQPIIMAATPVTSSWMKGSACGCRRSSDTAAAAPLLCAGIRPISPLRYWNAGPGKRVGIVGLGGLGHMGVKFAHALGAETVLFTTSPSKVADGKRLGADEVVISSDASAMKAQAGRLDLIVDTVAAAHGKVPVDDEAAIAGGIGHRSIPETQEVLDFRAEKGIACGVEVIGI